MADHSPSVAQYVEADDDDESKMQVLLLMVTMPCQQRLSKVQHVQFYFGI